MQRQQPIFRQEALQRLASPDQLDQAIAITSPRAWIGLSGLGIVLAAILLWGIFGSVPTRIYGEGIILYRGGEMFPAAAEGPGKLVEVVVAPGESVTQGQLVARLRQDALADEIRTARESLEALETQRRELAAHQQREEAERTAVAAKERDALERKTAILEDRAVYVERELRQREAVLRDGLVTPEQEDVRAAARSLSGLQAQREALAARLQREAAERGAVLHKQREIAVKKSKDLQDSAAFLEKSLKGRQVLLEKGYLAPQGVEETREKLHQTWRASEDARAHIEQLNLTELRAQHEARQQLAVLDKEIVEARNRLETATSRSRLAAEFEGKLPGTVEQTRDKLSQTYQEIEATRARIQELALSELKAQHEARHRLTTLDKEVLEAANRLANLETRLRLVREVEAPVSGIVQALDASIGDVLAAGQAVVTIAEIKSDEDRQYDAVVFFESARAKVIAPGMVAQVAPGTVDKHEFGTIVGQVQFVSESSFSERQIMQVLQNATLARQFAQRGAPVMGRVALAQRHDTPSGLQWSSGLGPPFAVTAGTLCQVSVTVRTQAPIALVIPFLRKLLHL